jgi:hypothetical protein
VALLAFARNFRHHGILTAADWVQFSADLHAAEEQLLRRMSDE